jgi:hypothetical protein
MDHPMLVIGLGFEFAGSFGGARIEVDDCAYTLA